ncbi:MAG: type II toxin-antitoxin system VapC family toxin [Candidatus Brockarchaeota archaeon]|nr:type II toxin-antitoxin system VapC family toxin [Candidatus Brockarchaeota archaeon]
MELSTTPIVACELFKGAYRSKRKNLEVMKVREILSRLKVLDFSISACEKYGKLVNDLERMGAPISDLDAMIASLALTHNEPLVTADREYFEKNTWLNRRIMVNL